MFKKKKKNGKKKNHSSRICYDFGVQKDFLYKAQNMQTIWKISDNLKKKKE